VIGSLLPEIIDQIGHLTTPDKRSQLLKKEHFEAGDCQVEGDLSASLAHIADALHAANVGHVRHHWRNEQLGVFNPSGDRLGNVERGAARPLGIATRAVHLVGWSNDGRMWVQQRALNKSNDPGQWDTLMGGMVSAHDTLATALARETWEEAGLHIGALQDVVKGGCVTIRRPTADAGDGGDDHGIGYVVENIDWFSGSLPDGVAPDNQDGEVAQFQVLQIPNLIERLHNNEFTLEAALILVAALDREPRK
jgi:8-oxo-dGTP pyrophosphatase MutT (NUDIX family)